MAELELERLNDNANVTVYMKGLGISHHNILNKNWEFLFIRKIPKHDLKISVREFREGLPDDSPIETVYPIPDNNGAIEIVTSNSVSIPTGGFHHRPSGNDFKAWKGVDPATDSRWMIDLSAELHQKPVRLRRKNYTPDLPSAGTPVVTTLLTVDNAVFYVASLSKRPYSITFKTNPDPNVKGDYRFSRVVGEWMGFDIEWQVGVGQTEIRFNNPLFSDIVLRRDPNISRYEIIVNNDCCEGETIRESDFHYYYDLLVDMPGEIFDEDLRLPTSESNTFAKLLSAESFNFESFNMETFRTAFVNLLLGGKEDDCHLVQCTDLDGISSLGDV